MNVVYSLYTAIRCLHLKVVCLDKFECPMECVMLTILSQLWYAGAGASEYHLERL